jgi:ABC-type cobalamin transport system permease subunit
MALAVSTIGINMALAGVPASVGIVIPFLVLTLVNLATAMVLLRNIDAGQQVGQGPGHLATWPQ